MIEDVSSISPLIGHPSPSFIILEAFARGRQHVLLARDWGASDQAYGFSDRVVNGRYFTPSDDGQPVVLWDAASRNPPPVGSHVEIMVPSLDAGEGSIRFDFSRAVEAEVEVIGHYRLRGGLRTGAVLMPLGTLSRLTGLGDDQVLWVAFTVSDYNYAGQITTAIRQSLPHYRVYGPQDIYRIIFSGAGQRASELGDPRITFFLSGAHVRVGSADCGQQHDAVHGPAPSRAGGDEGSGCQAHPGSPHAGIGGAFPLSPGFSGRVLAGDGSSSGIGSGSGAGILGPGRPVSIKSGTGSCHFEHGCDPGRLVASPPGSSGSATGGLTL